MSYVFPSSSSEGSTRRFDLHIVYRPDPTTSSWETPRLHQPLVVTHLFYDYVRKATDTEFNVVVLGRDLIFAHVWIDFVFALLLSTADCDDITADVIIADSR
ncbi:hypothetical protein F511_40653 [Dorcoceras hygrometricum]|uniref:Uncharacterized protein n=1 Tax=Dorcoceras hygrometricum TaxID=472368 RepID=A0A2Z7ANK0_9LAMI|nr:hypothetical protein F511_40653 [Dorcoceras hygrometricum]